MKALVRTAPSRAGVHYWDTWLRCARLAWYDGLARENREPGRLTGILHFDIGTIFHALLALHYFLEPDKAAAINTGTLRYHTETGPLETEEYAEAIGEAERLYRAYRVFWGARDFGKVLAVEREYEKALGTGEVTAAIDLVVKLSKKDLARNKLDGEPGVYLVDHKTRGSRDPAEYEMALRSVQFSTYAAVYGPEVKGFIVNLAYKGARPTFERILVPRMALTAEWEVSRGLLETAMREKKAAESLIEVGGLPEVRPGQGTCFKRSRVGWDFCSHYKSGRCSRKPQHGGRK